MPNDKKKYEGKKEEKKEKTLMEEISSFGDKISGFSRERRENMSEDLEYFILDVWCELRQKEKILSRAGEKFDM